MRGNFDLLSFIGFELKVRFIDQAKIGSQSPFSEESPTFPSL